MLALSLVLRFCVVLAAGNVCSASAAVARYKVRAELQAHLAVTTLAHVPDYPSIVSVVLLLC